MTKTPRLIGDNRQYERWRWQIFFITWLAYAAFYLTRKSFTVAKISMGDPAVLGLTSSQMSWIDGSELTSYAIGQFIWGIAGDRHGPRRIISFGMIGSIIASVCMGLSSSFWSMIPFAALQGFSQSTAWAPLNKNMGNFFSQHERGTVMGLWCTCYAMGGFVASLFDGYFGGLLGWRFAFFAPSIVLGIVWLLFLLLQRNRPEDVDLPPIEQYHGEPETAVEKQTGSPDETEGSWKLIVEVIESPMIILLSISYFFMKMARYGILLWTPLYLSETLKTGMSASGAIGGLFELAGLISVFLAGVASDKLLGSRRNPITIVCVLLSAVLLWTLGSLPHSRWAIGGGLFAIGFLLFPPDALVAAMAAVDFGTKKGASTAVGLVNGLGSFGAMLGGILPGFLHAHWSWNAIFSMLATSLFLSGLLLLPKWNALPTTSTSLQRERKLAFESGVRAKR